MQTCIQSNTRQTHIFEVILWSEEWTVLVGKKQDGRMLVIIFN